MAKKKDRFVRVRYDDKTDAFVIEYINENNDEWQFNSSYQCHTIKEQCDDDEPQFIHFSIVRELQKIVSLGYEFVVR